MGSLAWAGGPAAFRAARASRMMRAMRSFLLFAALLACSVPAARAQSDFGPRHARPDTARRTLAGARQVWAHVGMGWMGSPHQVRDRYRAGLGFGLSGDLRLRDRAALRARLDYQDMPSGQYGIISNAAGYLGASNAFGNGRLGTGATGIALSPIRHVWLEAGAGRGYFDNGFPPGQTFLNGADSTVIRVPGATGWGWTWNAAARYEFQPTPRDRALVELAWSTLQAPDVMMRFWSLRVGYRAF